MRNYEKNGWKNGGPGYPDPPRKLNGGVVGAAIAIGLAGVFIIGGVINSYTEDREEDRRARSQYVHHEEDARTPEPMTSLALLAGVPLLLKRRRN